MRGAPLPRLAIAAACAGIAVLAIPAGPGHAATTHPHAARAAPGPVVPAAPPPPAVIPPLDTAPVHEAVPVPPPPVRDDAPGQTVAIAGGLRLTFGAERADFSPASAVALKALAQTGIDNRKLVFNVYAHAAGGTEDTSSPRRLSLQRGLAVRSALIAGGIVSTRIYVHALGATADTAAHPVVARQAGAVSDNAVPGNGAADRVDVVTASLDTAPPPAAPRPRTP